jgi:hypothetical protein
MVTIPSGFGGLSLANSRNRKEVTYDIAYANSLGLAYRPVGCVSYSCPSVIVED